MLRSVKYGLYGAVLAGVVAGTAAWSNVDKTVTLVIDGHATQLHTTADRVSDVLHAAGYRVGEHDLVAPGSRATVHDGSTVIYKRGRLLHLDVNGTRRDVWTTAPTVSVALAQLGYSTADFASVSRSERLALNPTDIAVRTPRPVTVVADGKTQYVTTTDSTVGLLLGDLGIALKPTDRLSVAATSALESNQKVVVTRVEKATVTKTSALPFSVKKTADPTIETGQSRLVTVGKNGAARTTYAVVYVDGKPVGQTPTETVVVAAPTTQVMKVGTGPHPAAPVVVTAGSAQAIGREMAAARGWGDDQFSCLITLWDHESGWRVTAENSGSGAYGIPQSLPGDKMASAGPNWRTDAATQIQWGLDYIADRYHDPCNAWAMWQAHGSWY